MSRPPLLGKLIDINARKEDDVKNYYSQFLALAQQAKEETVSAQLSIESRYKIAGSAVLDDKDKNDSLIKIFLFYCKIQLRYGKEFPEIDIKHGVWTFEDTVLFFREFGAIPTLLSMEDVKFVWEMKDCDWIASGDTTRHMLSLDFENFKDFLIRMALCAYHKPGLKKLIISTNGFMPKNSKIIESFCSFLRLYDSDWIQNFLRTEGRDTQGFYNYRSAGEKNLRLSAAVTMDMEARSLTQLDYTERTLAPISTQSIIGGIVAARNGGKNIFGEKLKVPTTFAPARTTEVVTPSLNRNKALNDLNQSLVPAQLMYKIDNFDFNKDDSSKSSADRAATAAIEEDIREKLKEMEIEEEDHFPEQPLPPAPHHNRDRDRDRADELLRQGSIDSSSTLYNYFENNPVVSHSQPMLAVFRDNSLNALKTAIQQDYRPGLVKLLSKYCYPPRKAVETDISCTGGPFIDLGLLTVGNQISILLKVTNSSGDVIGLDTTTRDFDSDDTKVVTYPKPLVHGFTRNISVSFTVQQPQKRSVIAFIEVSVVAPRGGRSVIIDCPVHYRVDPLATKDSLPSCTRETLPHLLTLKEYALTSSDKRIDYKMQSLSFERKKVLEGSWATRNRTMASSSFPTTKN
eukprot:gene32669-42310_t